jgi:hypothetical protein
MSKKKKKNKDKEIINISKIDKIIQELPENCDRIWERLGLTPRLYEQYCFFNPSAPKIKDSERQIFESLLLEELSEMGLTKQDVKLSD